MLKAWQPVPSLTKTIIMFFVLAIIFLALGIPMIIFSSNIQQYSIRYDNQCQISTNTTCSLILTIPTFMQGPIFVYYELRNFYQNHRLYAKSISYDQLKGKSISSSTAQTDCQPIVYNSQLYRNLSFNNITTLDPNGIANPCGIVAYTVFNDSYTVTNNAGNDIYINDTGIAWPSDLNKFKVEN